MGKPFAGLTGDPLSFSPHEPSLPYEDPRAADASNRSSHGSGRGVDELRSANGNLPSVTNGKSFGSPGRESGPVADDYDHEDAIINAASNPRIEALITKALSGMLPRARALKSYEPDKLNARHISVIMLRAIGYRQNRIAELTGYEPAVVSVVLGHPDSKLILAAILSEGARQTIDVSKTIRSHAPSMLKVVKDVALNDDEKTPNRLKAAFKWLDLYKEDENAQAGRGQGGALPMSDEAAVLLSTAIREAANEGRAEPRTIPYIIVGEGSDEAVSEVSPTSDPAYLPVEAPNPDTSEIERQLDAIIASAETSDGPSISLVGGSSNGKQVSTSEMEEEVA